MTQVSSVAVEALMTAASRPHRLIFSLFCFCGRGEMIGPQPDSTSQREILFDSFNNFLDSNNNTEYDKKKLIMIYYYRLR